MENTNRTEIEDLTFKFALDIVSYCQVLEDSKKLVLAKPISMTGTYIGAKIRDAHRPDKKAEYMHKIKLAAEEAEDLKYLLLLCKSSENYPDCTKLLAELEVIIKKLTDIIGASKKQIGFKNLA